jgi:hypothetical protein
MTTPFATFHVGKIKKSGIKKAQTVAGDPRLSTPFFPPESCPSNK